MPRAHAERSHKHLINLGSSNATRRQSARSLALESSPHTFGIICAEPGSGSAGALGESMLHHGSVTRDEIVRGELARAQSHTNVRLAPRGSGSPRRGLSAAAAPPGLDVRPGEGQVDGDNPRRAARASGSLDLRPKPSVAQSAPETAAPRHADVWDLILSQYLLSQVLPRDPHDEPSLLCALPSPWFAEVRGTRHADRPLPPNGTLELQPYHQVLTVNLPSWRWQPDALGQKLRRGARVSCWALCKQSGLSRRQREYLLTPALSRASIYPLPTLRTLTRQLEAQGLRVQTTTDITAHLTQIVQRLRVVPQTCPPAADSPVPARPSRVAPPLSVQAARAALESKAVAFLVVEAVWGDRATRFRSPQI